MARTLVTGSCLFLLTLHLLSGTAATPGKTNDREERSPVWLLDRQSSTSAHNQPLSDDNEGSEPDYDGGLSSPWQQHDARSSVDNNNDSNDDDDDDDETSSKTSYGVTDVKRKWNKNNVRIWGKRKWSSKGLNMWGKRRSNGSSAEIIPGEAGGWNYGAGWMNEDPLETVKTVGGKDDDDKRKWAKNNLKIWGKRFPDKSSDQEIAGNGMEGGKRYGQEDYPIMRGSLVDHFPASLHKRNSRPSVEQKYGKKGWANNNVRIWG